MGWCRAKMCNEQTEELAELRLMEHYFLLVFIEGGDAHISGEKDVGMVGTITSAENALPCGKLFEIDLPGQHVQLIIIQIRKQRHTAEKIG